MNLAFYARWASHQTFLDMWNTDLSAGRILLMLPSEEIPPGAAVGIRLIAPGGENFFLEGTALETGPTGETAVDVSACESALVAIAQVVKGEGFQEQLQMGDHIWIAPEFGPADDAPTEFGVELELDLD